jgi:hypothetical protein
MRHAKIDIHFCILSSTHLSNADASNDRFLRKLCADPDEAFDP